MEYLPKKDLFYGFVIWSAPIILIPFLIFSFSVTIFIIFVFCFLLSYWLWNSTNYKIEECELIVKCWIFRRKVKIKDIVKVRRTKNYLASYALAVNRLEITENNKNKYYISPNNFEGFISELKKCNSNIMES